MFSKKNVLTMSIIFGIIVLCSSIFAYSTQNFKPEYAATTANVNLRKQANLNAASVVSQVPNNTAVKVVGSIDNFYIVQLKSNQVGLLSKDYVKITGESLPGALVYENITKYKAQVNSANTNVRSGPGTQFSSYTKLGAGTIVEVIGKIENFNLIVTENNIVGMIREDLITKYTGSSNSGGSNTGGNTGNGLTEDQQYVLNLINEARVANGLPKLATDNLLQATAQTKAVDMVKNNYFDHNSPTYGSPFNMMKNAGISYKTAGENIAGNSNLKNAVEGWLASDTHRQNILSNAYNYAGIGVEKSDKYGYVIVAMFIGR